MDRLGVGIIGCGRISTVHALGYMNNERAKILAVSDVNPDVAREKAALWGVPENRVFTDYHDLLALKEIDLVEILLPHGLHLQAVIDAAAAGKHIALQKPMAIDLADANKMIAVTKQAGVQFKVFENFIFLPPMQRAKAMLDAGEIGDPITIRMKSFSGTSPNAWYVPPSSWAWHHDRRHSGGGAWITDDGHHMYALGWYFMGAAEEIFAWHGETEIGPNDVVDAPCIVTWRYPGGRFGTWEAVKSLDLVLNTDHYACDEHLEITGTKGVIWVMHGHGKMLDVPPVILFRDRGTRSFSDMPTGWDQGFKRSTEHFVDAILKGEPPSLTGEQGRDILRWGIAAEESAITGRTVRL